MAAARQTTGQADRRVLVGALIALGAVTGASFGRVFEGTSPAVRLAGAGALAVGLAALLARRHLSVSLLASAAGLVLALGLLVFPRTTWAGVPTDDTARAILDALGQVGRRAAREVAPAPAFPSLMTAGVIAVWSAGTAAHALAVRSRSAVLPLLPPAALFAFAGVVTEEGPRPGYVLAFLAVAFAVLFGAALDRVSAWGPALHRDRYSSPVGARWARWLGLAAAVVALLVPGVLPGLESDPLLRVRRPGARVAISPIVDIRPNLLRNPPADLFYVDTDRGAYWRLITLDRFDGRLWTAGYLNDPGAEDIEAPFHRLGGPEPLRGIQITQTFEIADLAVPWLPAAYRPQTIRLAGMTARWDVDAGLIATDDEPEEGFRYGVTSLAPAASPQFLNELDPAEAQVDHRYRALPPDTPLRIYGIARDLTEAEGTPFRKMLAIQEHLRDFAYDERAPAGHGIDDILFFLERSRTGYCEQFAGTMAVLVRALGYPSRVAVGFLPGDPDRTGRYRVTTSDVHAWTEVYFPRYGWLAFEPTPTRDNPTAGYLAHVPAGVRPDANLPRTGGLDPPAAPIPGATQRKLEAATSTATDPVPPPVRPAAPTRELPVREILLAILAAGGLLLLLTPPVKAIVRAVGLARARTPRGKVLAAYGILVAGAADVGLGRRPGETLWEYRTRLARDVPFSDGHLDRLIVIAGRALYSPSDVAASEASEAVTAARTALRGIRRHAGPVRVAAGAIRPPGWASG